MGRLKLLVKDHSALVTSVRLLDQPQVQDSSSGREGLANLLLSNIRSDLIDKNVVVICFLHVHGYGSQIHAVVVQMFDLVILSVDESLHDDSVTTWSLELVHLLEGLLSSLGRFE